MAKAQTENVLESLAKDLSASFRQWEYLHEYGGSDPFHSDGTNLNLVRNHILSYKRQIEKYIEKEDEEPSLFRSSFPDIYYKDTPPIVPYSYMARANEIRKRASEQLSIYEKDPNFCFLRDNHEKVFEKGETKATKAAGLYPTISGSLSWYKKYIEQDDLISMRRVFYEPYESKSVRWAEHASKFRSFMEKEHGPEDNVPAVNEYEEENELYIDDCSEKAAGFETEKELHESSKPSLDNLIQKAKQQTSKAVKDEHIKSLEEQLSLF